MTIRSLVLALGAISGAASAFAADPPKGPDQAWWDDGAPERARAAEYEGIERKAYYVTMPDGVRLAVDVHLPAGLQPGAKLPTIIEQTRYYRSVLLKPEAGGGCKPRVGTTLHYFVPRGYAYVVVDARGSGASFGSRKLEYSDEEVRDGATIVDWSIRQPWSNGIVGATGQSYVGTTAEMLLRNRHPAVKAVMPTFSGYDFYTEITFPGGIQNTAFVKQWAGFNRMLDAGEQAPNSTIVGPCPVDEDRDGALLRQAIAGHAKNFNLWTFLQHVTFRDDTHGGARADASGLFRYQRAIDATNVPVYAISGWQDSGYALGAVRRFLNSTSPTKRMLIGPWNHGGRFFYGPGVREPTATSFKLDAEKLRFFDYYLKGIDNGFSSSAPVHYFTTGANAWREAQTWPPVTSNQTWCFAAEGLLDAACAPPADAGIDRYEGGAAARSGELTRWHTTMGPYPVAYPDRAEEDRALLTYTTPPLTQDVEVTGEPVVTLFAAVDDTDGDFFVYLEEVTPDGQVNYVTEGQLRASRRREGKLPYRTLGPSHSHARKDAAKVTPNEPFRMDIALQPLSHQFKQGSRVRIAIAPADRSQFLENPERAAVWRMFRDETRRSKIDLPIAK
ncbi:MAG: CocE/NonD family hydrolase [Alphaproteobacteria bacterium]|nr:CocE/NonD family hydrolase [Alphaproteobacteria bacterium]